MPIDHNIGYSENTPIKHAHLREYLRIQAKIVQSIFARRPEWDKKPYMLFDINAGDGGTWADPGSPLIAAQELHSASLPFQGVCIEVDPGNAAALKTTIADRYNLQVICGNHCDVLPEYIKPPVTKDNQWTYGALIADPNGVDDNNIAWRLLHEFNTKYPRIDMFIYIAAASHKRVRTSGGKIQPLADSILSIGKSTWIIREPIAKQERTWIIGTNWDSFPAYNALGFHNIKGEAGQAILDRLTYSKRERMQAEQVPLPFEQPPYRTYAEYLAHPEFKRIRAMAMARAGGICEICRQAKATEVHHYVYPPWGTFESNADNLVAICHKCHCAIHGKDN